MHTFLRNNDKFAVLKLLSPSSTKPGFNTRLTGEDEDIIAERLIFAAKRVLSV